MAIPTIALGDVASKYAAFNSGFTRQDILDWLKGRVENGELDATLETPERSFMQVMYDRGASQSAPTPNERSKADRLAVCALLKGERMGVPPDLLSTIPPDQRGPFLPDEAAAASKDSGERKEVKRLGILGALVEELTADRPGLLNGAGPNVSALAERVQQRFMARLGVQGTTELPKGWGTAHIREVIAEAVKAYENVKG